MVQYENPSFCNRECAEMPETSQYFESESTTLDLDVLRNFQSHQIIQQVGAAFRLGKDEEVYPLNRTYVELNFNILLKFFRTFKRLLIFFIYFSKFILLLNKLFNNTRNSFFDKILFNHFVKVYLFPSFLLNLNVKIFINSFFLFNFT